MRLGWISPVTPPPQSKSHVFLLTEITSRFAYDIPDPLLVEDSQEADRIAIEICDLIAAGFEHIKRLAGSLQSIGKVALE